MKRNLLIILILVAVIILAGVGFIVASQGGIREAEILSKGYSINIISEIPGKTLIWNDKAKLESVANSMQIFNKSIQDFKDNKFYKINKLDIVLTYTDGGEVPIKVPNGVVSSTSHSFSGDLLKVSIYVNENEAPEGDVETAFNQQLLFFFANLSPVPRGEDSTKVVTMEDRLNFFLTINESNFPNNQNYPIKVL